MHEFGITDPTAASSVFFFGFVDSNTTPHPIRLYIWSDQGNLRPNSGGVPLYANINIQPESLGQWIEFSVPDIVFPDTFWIGLCYSYLVYPPDWYLAFDAYSTDYHTYYNSKGGPDDWLSLANMGLAHPVGIRVYVTDASGIVEEESDMPVSFSFGLKTNPAKDKALFVLTLPKATTISLGIYDVSGRMVDKLVSSTWAAGTYEIPWTADVTAGVYFYKFESSGETTVGKLILVK